jgi:hypothetical protein
MHTVAPTRPFPRFRFPLLREQPAVRPAKLEGPASLTNSIPRLKLIIVALLFTCAQVAELADALASGASGRKVVEVRVLSWAPFIPSSRLVPSHRSPAKIAGLPVPLCIE